MFSRRAIRWLLLVVCAITGLTIALGARPHRTPAALLVQVDHDFLPADGLAEAHIDLRATDGRTLTGLKLQSIEGRNLATEHEFAQQAAQQAQMVEGAAYAHSELPAYEPGVETGAYDPAAVTYAEK